MRAAGQSVRSNRHSHGRHARGNAASNEDIIMNALSLHSAIKTVSLSFILAAAVVRCTALRGGQAQRQDPVRDLQGRFRRRCQRWQRHPDLQGQGLSDLDRRHQPRGNDWRLQGRVRRRRLQPVRPRGHRGHLLRREGGHRHRGRRQDGDPEELERGRAQGQRRADGPRADAGSQWHGCEAR